MYLHSDNGIGTHSHASQTSKVHWSTMRRTYRPRQAQCGVKKEHAGGQACMCRCVCAKVWTGNATKCVGIKCSMAGGSGIAGLFSMWSYVAAGTNVCASDMAPCCPPPYRPPPHRHHRDGGHALTLSCLSSHCHPAASLAQGGALTCWEFWVQCPEGIKCVRVFHTILQGV